MLFISSQIGDSHVPTNRNAIVSMVIGDNFIKQWVGLCQGEWVNYAKRHGFDIIMINRPLDESGYAASRSPAWQKLLILDQPWAAKYERIIWLDSDILINPTAPNILGSVPDHTHVGVPVGSRDHESPILHAVNERLYNVKILPEEWPGTHRAINGSIFRDTINVDLDDSFCMFCTGVLVVSPKYHREIFLRSYNNYNSESRLYEQPALSYEICKSGKVTEFSTRFNWMPMLMMLLYFPEFWSTPFTKEKYLEMLPMLRKEFAISYFLHFAGCGGLMKFISSEDLYPPIR